MNSSHRAKSLSAAMNFVKRRKTSSKVDIPDKARKEIEFLFLHKIVIKVEKHNIPPRLILNIDQTPLKYVPVGNETLAPRGGTSVTIEGSSDKRSISGTFAISLHGDFLPMLAKLLKACLDIDFQKVSASVSTQSISQVPTNPSSS